MNKTTPRHVIIILLKIGDKKKNSESGQRKQDKVYTEEQR